MGARDQESSEDAGFGESSRYAAHLDRGWALLDRGELEAAKTSAEHARSARPDDPDAALLQGAIALAQGDPRQGLRCYEQAIELDPEYLEPYAAAAALCLYDLEDPTRALAYLNEALELDGLGPFERLELGLLAAECDLVADDAAGAQQHLAPGDEAEALEAALNLVAQRPKGPLPATASEAEMAAWAFLFEDPDGERLEGDERAERAERIMATALRRAQLQLDAAMIERALALTSRLVELFAQDADSWSLHAEALLRAGHGVEAVAAGLQALDLDRRAPLPPWMPAATNLSKQIRTIIEQCPEPRIRGLAHRDHPLAIVVSDQPPTELILEGVSPRIPVLATSARLGEPGSNPPPFVTGVAVYRRNLARFARDGEGLSEELEGCLFEELATALELPSRARVALGLPPGPEAPPPVPDVQGADAAPEPERTDPPKRRRATGRRKLKD